jgi:hypothetical protein
VKKKKKTINRLQTELDEFVTKYKQLPRRESFSGWHYLDKIEGLEKELERLRNDALEKEIEQEEKKIENKFLNMKWDDYF